MKMLGILGILILSATSFLACSSGEGGSSSDNTPPGASLDIKPSFSACGGFLAAGSEGAKIPPSPDPATYCDAERLLWNYDPETRTLGLLDARMQLNCCGQHSIDVAVEDGVHVVTQTDAPEKLEDGSEARCSCMCVFDYAADVSPVESSTISMRILRNVTDQKPAITLVWEGMVDLTAGSGEVVISTESAEPWCSNKAP
ncbi:hypothetical protein [Polyangium sp. 15x6]|uniref:hypothetical protein n=1 Tax=Polyangium sp. 15x6 TaxID=3042687 RepID=UPI002499EC56|nr:hypothetical protein [Polyangium sp. 15x6]MDI3285011.1 hypothetical protein [Polyangium sp. 15x6]